MFVFEGGQRDSVVSCTPGENIFTFGAMPEKTRVKRCLFGRPNHAVLKKELQTTLNEEIDEDNLQQEKWNFDFGSNRPTIGRYQWSKVGPDQYIPEFYRKGYYTKTKTVLGYCSKRPAGAPRSTTQLRELDNLSHGNVTTNSSVTDHSDLLQSIENDSDLVNREGHVYSSSSSSNTTACDNSTVQSKITDYIKSGKRKRGYALEWSMSRKTPKK